MPTPLKRKKKKTSSEEKVTQKERVTYKSSKGNQY